MAKTSMKIKQQRKPKFSTREYSRCMVSAVSASVNWHTKDRSRELRKPAGKPKAVWRIAKKFSAGQKM